MKATIELDVPEFQIGEMVRVYFPDSAVMDGRCEQSEEQKPVEPNLKEQEAVKPVKQIEENEWTVCGHCREHLISKWMFCPYCGRAVKWDD